MPAARAGAPAGRIIFVPFSRGRLSVSCAYGSLGGCRTMSDPLHALDSDLPKEVRPVAIHLPVNARRMADIDSLPRRRGAGVGTELLGSSAAEFTSPGPGPCGESVSISDGAGF